MLTDIEQEHHKINKDFNDKHSKLQQTYNKLKNDVTKSRPFFELKSDLNKKLEQQKQRLVKIEEGIQVSKNAYQHTLRKLQLISEDIHNTRNIKKAAVACATNQCTGKTAETPDEVVTGSKSVISRQLSVASSEVSIGSLDDNATWKPGLLDPCHDTISLNSKEEFNLDRCSNNTISEQLKSESEGGSLSSRDEDATSHTSSSEGKRAGMIIQITDAMKAMQSDSIASPFECITSHSLDYSVPNSPAVDLSVHKGDDL